MIGLIATFVVWGQVGGQTHLDMMPWHVKLGLGAGVAYAAVRATMSAVDGKPAWNGGTLKWFGIMLALVVACGLSSYYFHIYGEGEEEGEEETVTSQLVSGTGGRGMDVRTGVGRSRVCVGSAATGSNRPG
jgi:hypothetical protein